MDNGIDLASQNLAQNIIGLRNQQGLSQLQLAQKAGIPRSTLTYIESGEGNPSLANLIKLSNVLNLSIEELISSPRSESKLIRAQDVPSLSKSNGMVEILKILPDPIPGMEIDKIMLSPGAKMRGTPHTTKTREYLYCQAGTIRVYVHKKQYELKTGDVLIFPGDEHHAYENMGTSKKAVGFSVVVFAPSYL